MKTCTNRIPDNCDSYECGRPVTRAGRCEACLPAAIAGARTRLRAMERATGEARARLRDLEGDTTDHAKRLAEIDEILPELRKMRDHFEAQGEGRGPLLGMLRSYFDQVTFLREDIRAACEALAAAGIPDDGRRLAERVKAMAERTTPKRCDDCGGTDTPHGHRFGCGMEPEDETIVATAGDAKPMRTDGLIVRRTAAERADEIDRRWGVDPDAERRLDAFLAATAPPVSKRLPRAPLTSDLPDLGIAAAHGATPQALAEDVASQVLHVVRAYALAEPATLAPDALALRGRIRVRLGLPSAAEMPAATAERCDVCGRASLLGLDHDYHPEPDIEPAVGDDPEAT